MFAVQWYRFMSALAFGVMTAFLTGGFWDASPVLGVAVGAPFAWLTVRACRVGVVLSDAGVEVRGQFRTRRAPWSKVADVRWSSGSSMMLAWRVPVFILRDGGALKAEEVRSLKEGTIVDDVIEAAHGRLIA